MRTPTRTAHLALAAAIALGAGCNANHVLGSATPDSAAGAGSGGAPGTGGAGSGGASSPEDAGMIELDATGMEPPVVYDTAIYRPEVGPLGPSQSWTGYVENFKFPSGSSAIHFTIATDASGNVAGQIVFGQGPPPPPATDPNIGYPPALEASYSGGLLIITSYIAEGYVYQIDRGTLVSDRLRFGIANEQLWAGWCALQTTPAGSTSCVPRAAYLGYVPTPDGTCSYVDTTTSTSTPIDCVKANLCLSLDSPCDCSAGGPCKLKTDLYDQPSFDVFVTGNTASGSCTLSTTPPNVHFVLDTADAGAG